MMVARPAQQLACFCPLQEEMEVVLPGEPDPAVELQPVMDQESLAVTGGDLCGVGSLGAARVVLGDCQACVVGDGVGALDREKEIGEAVL